MLKWSNNNTHKIIDDDVHDSIGDESDINADDF